MSRPVDSHEVEQAPARLLDQIEDPAAAVLVSANHLWTPDAGEEARAWYALQRRRAVAGRRRVWRAGGFALATAALAAAVFAVARRAPPSPELAVRTIAAPTESPSPSPARPPLATVGGGGDVAIAAPGFVKSDARLPPAAFSGEVVATNGVRARLSRQGIATLQTGPADEAAIALERGRLAIDAGAAFAVRAASLRMLGDRGRFRVDTDGARVGVTVQSGVVRIYSSRRLVARVFAGQHWAFAPRAGSTDVRAPALEPSASASPSEASSSSSPPPSPARDCLRLAREGATDHAVACFQEQAASTGLSAEVALLEIARLRRDVSGDLGGAERALDEYRRRFPHGSLSAEAGIARVELLLRLGRPADAFVEARGLPEGEGDFWRAVCLSKLGRREEARAAFDGYLARPDATRRREAQRRRAELVP